MTYMRLECTKHEPIRVNFPYGHECPVCELEERIERAEEEIDGLRYEVENLERRLDG